VVVFFLTVRAKIRKLFRDLQRQAESAASTSTPSRIHLDAVDAIEWRDEEANSALVEPLPELGFEDAGLYEIREIEGVRLHAWVNPDQAAIAVVYEHPAAGAWMDFVSRYDDGTRITFTNTAQGGSLDHQPGHVVERRPGLDPRSLYQEFFEARPERSAIPVRADEFVAVFEKAYADEMDWRNGRGGPTEREIRAIAAESGFGDDDVLIGATRDRMQEQALDDLDATLRRQFSRETSLSVADWERVRDRLVFVHDRLTPERLDEAAAEWVDDVPAPSAVAPGESPRAAFAAFNDRLPSGRRFVKLGEVAEPIVAEVYSAPDAD
jgi:hypothetical protein